MAPVRLYQKIAKGLSLLGHQGLAVMAQAGFDICCWDALAKAAGVPLVTLLGGTVQRVRTYNSNGLGLVSPAEVADETQALVAEGDFDAIKVRLGRPTLEDDLAALHAVRRAVGEGVTLPCDFNQGLTVMEVIRRGHALDREGVC